MFYNIFERLCHEKGVKPSRVADDIGISRATVTNWKKNGYSPRANILEKLSDYFGVSPAVFMDGKDGPEQYMDEKPALTRRDEREIEKILEETRKQLENADGLMFDGDPASPEAIESLLDAMRIGLELAKQKNKEKYTPKKYRKG